MAGFWDRIKGLVRGRPTASPVGPDSAPAAGLDAGLDRLLPLLAAAGLEPTATELGDILWLASHLDRRPAADPISQRDPGGAKRTTEPPADPGRPGKAADARPGSAAQGPIEPPPTLNLFPANRPVGAGRAAVGFRAPAEPGLPQALAYARALRPLHRRVPSRTRLRLDEEVTAERLAEQRTAGHLFWEPVWVPAREPWFELALVLDLGATMVVWRELLDDLRRLCAQSGAFRRVRVWGLDADGPEPRLYTGSTQGARACRAEVLVGGPERRLVLVASDCIGAAWHSGAVNRWLGLWGDQAPLALLQMLPQRLWEVTALGRGRPVRLRARGPGAPGGALELAVGSRVARPLAPGTDAQGLRFPVLSLEPAALLGWGRLLGGSPDAWCGGVAFGPQTRYAAPAPTLAPTPTQIEAPVDGAELQARIDGFQTASPLARRLAALLAAVPLTLPVMRLVQRTRLPESGPGHLAEIFASGLLCRHPDLAADGDHPFYDFQGDGRERLLDGLGEADARAVLEAISGYVAERTGRALDFAALLAAPHGLALAPAGARIGDANTRHFASIGAGVLRRLGGSYATLAEGLTALAQGDAAGLARIAGIDPGTAAVTDPVPRLPTAFRDPFSDGSGDGPELVWLPGETFRMGDMQGIGRQGEHPVSEVELDDFAVGKYPVTFTEYDLFCQTTGRDLPAFEYRERTNRPVVNVSWQDAVEYCDWLTIRTGETYRLLTEAQWEYACRAGSTTAYSFGDDARDLARFAWFKRNSTGLVHPVGEKLPNAWSLYDMHGNVWEWVQDWLGPYAEQDNRNPTGPESGSSKVYRGGSWNVEAPLCRSSSRQANRPDHRSRRVGFRVGRLGPPHLPPAQAAPIPDLRDTLREGTQGPVMVWLPGGDFTMGQDDSPYHDEKPAHPVRVGAFSMGQYPVTFAEFDRFCAATGRQKPGDEGWGREERPVINVNWDDARAYCDWLSRETGEDYRLATEAEWEYACRAGTTTPWSCGDDEAQLQDHAWFSKNAEGKTHPVGGKAPNPWHLYDMHGNVWEWCGLNYSGDRLSLNFQDIEVRAVLQLFADFTGLRFVASDTVSGNMTLRLKNVPWDEALDRVLRGMGLSIRQRGDALFVAPTPEVEAADRLVTEATLLVDELQWDRSRVVPAFRTDVPNPGLPPALHRRPYGGPAGDEVETSGDHEPASSTAAAMSVLQQPASENPSGVQSVAFRVIRGGSWGNVAGHCRSTYCYKCAPSDRSNTLGFRLSRTGPWRSYPVTLAAEPPQPRPADPAKQGSSEPGPAPTPELQPLQGFRDRFAIVRRDGREQPVQAPELVYLPGGTFLMGDERGQDHEKPAHRVRLPAFALGRTPVTWGDFRRFCEATNSHWPEWLEQGSEYHLETGKDDYYAKRGVAWDALDLPVVGIAWADALAYCEWLSELTGKPYRLPTEAEWEYACRAGTQSRWSFGDDEAKLRDHAWYSANAEGRLHPVAQKRPNPWGLYDIHGNCWEWCADRYAGDYYWQLADASLPVGSAVRAGDPYAGKGPGPHSGPYRGRPGKTMGASGARKPASGGAADASGFEQPASESPSGPESGSGRVVRGGAFRNVADDCRSAYRGRLEPSYRDGDLGFRLSRTL